MEYDSSEYDPYKAEIKADPYPWWKEARSNCPVHRYELSRAHAEAVYSSPLVARPTTQFWTVFRHEDCTRVLNDPAGFPAGQGPGVERLTPPNGVGMLLYADGDIHRAQRRVASRAFTQRMVNRVRPRIADITSELLDEMTMLGGGDFLEHFAIPLPILVIAEMLGVEKERLPDFKRWSDIFVTAFGGDAETAAGSPFEAFLEFNEYFGGKVEERRAAMAKGSEVPDDVLTVLMTKEDDNPGPFDELLDLQLCLQLLLVGGNESTRNGIASAAYLFSVYPAERAKLMGDKALIPQAVEEVLRFMSPVEGLFRTTAAEVDIAGTLIPSDEKVRICYAAANRDEAVWPDADVFRVDRPLAEAKQHLAFGSGAHLCLGAPLARAEMAIAFELMLERLPLLRLDPGEAPVWDTMLIMNGFRKLPMLW